MNKDKSIKKGRINDQQIIRKLKDRNDYLSLLEELFNKSYFICEYSSASLQDVNQILDYDKPLEQIFTFLPNFINEFKRFNEELKTLVIHPFQKHKAEHNRKNKEINRTLMRIWSELSGIKEDAEKSKEDYFKAASQLDKVETALTMLINSIESGNLGFNSRVKEKTGNLVNNALDEVLAQRKITEEKCKQYKAIIEERNKRIKEEQISYDTSIKELLDINCNSDKIIKEILKKYVELLEKNTKLLHKRMQALETSIINTKVENEEQEWARSSKYELMFTHVEFAKYESTYFFL